MAKRECRNIFLLGRPGGGKSELYRRLTPRLKTAGFAREFPRVDDFPKLLKIFVNDKNFEKCYPTEDGGYKVTDHRIWDDILKEVNSEVKGLNKVGRIIFIEFARPNYVHSLKNFAQEILSTAVMVYIDCSFTTCWKRNVRRHERNLAAGMDDHLVPRKEMEETYLYDDKDKLVEWGKELKIPIVVVNTDYEGMAHYKGIVERIIQTIEDF